MKKIICMFPGQGSQKVGMGEDLFEKFPRQIQQANQILGYNIKELCLQDKDGLLGRTDYTQPSLYVVNALSYLDLGREPICAIGHSLGEYNALFSAGVFDFATGLKLVQKRGQIMNKIEGGGMAAVLGLNRKEIEETITSNNLSKSIDIANLNAPMQTVISGLKESIQNAEQAFLGAGAKRYVILPTSGAFHSRYMQEPQQEFAQFVAQFEFQKPKFDVISNFTAQAYSDKKQETLVAQISNSVRWVETIKQLLDKCPDAEFIECGPGKVLSGLLRQIKR